VASDQAARRASSDIVFGRSCAVNRFLHRAPVLSTSLSLISNTYRIRLIGDRLRVVWQLVWAGLSRKRSNVDGFAILGKVGTSKTDPQKHRAQLERSDQAKSGINWWRCLPVVRLERGGKTGPRIIHMNVCSGNGRSCPDRFWLFWVDFVRILN
jgi:hypothetical protein